MIPRKTVVSPVAGAPLPLPLPLVALVLAGLSLVWAMLTFGPIRGIRRTLFAR
jgi:hypothetical protein